MFATQENPSRLPVIFSLICLLATGLGIAFSLTVMIWNAPETREAGIRAMDFCLFSCTCETDWLRYFVMLPIIGSNLAGIVVSLRNSEVLPEDQGKHGLALGGGIFTIPFLLILFFALGCNW